MQEFPVFFVVLTLLAYIIGQTIHTRYPHPLTSTLLLAVAIVILVLTAFDIEYAHYEEHTEILKYLLTPATIALAVPLYRQLPLLKKHKFAVLLAIFSGVLANGLVILLLSLLFRVPFTEFATLLPKSITVAVAIPITEGIGGIVDITVVAIFITGQLGNIFAEWFCRVAKVEEPVAKGLAIGTASHAVGTARAFQIGEVEGAFSSMALCITAVMTVFTTPLFAALAQYGLHAG